MKIPGLRHVALKVTNMHNSKQFYHGVLGMPYAGEHEEESMAYYRADGHHDLALFLVDGVDNTTSSFDHVAFQLQGGRKELDMAQAELETYGNEVTSYSHREVQSLYCNDPVGNQIELYVHVTE